MTATTDGYCYIKMVLAARAPDRMHRCERYILSQVVTNRDVSMYRFDSICFGRAG